MINELTQTTLTLDQWLVERDKVVGQVKRLIHLWFENELGTHRECAKHLGCTQSTVTYHRSKLIKSGELEGEIDQSKQTRNSDRISIKPVENFTPIPTPPINDIRREPQPQLVTATVVEDDEFRVSRCDSDEAERDYDECLRHIDAIVQLTKKYFHSGWDNGKWYELAGECRTIEACCTNHCGSNYGAGSQRRGAELWS